MQGCPQGTSKIDIHVLFQNLTAELFLLESPDDSYFPKSGGSTFLKTVGSHFSEICGNKITAYICKFVYCVIDVSTHKTDQTQDPLN